MKETVIVIKDLCGIFPEYLRIEALECQVPFVTALHPHEAGIFSVRIRNNRILLKRSNKGKPAVIAAENCMSGRPFSRVYMYFENRCPTWPEMVNLNYLLFFTDDIPTFQVHPCSDQYVNDHKYALHIWKHQTDFMSHVILGEMRSLTESVLEEFKNKPFPSKRKVEHGEVSGKQYIAIWGGNVWPTWEEVCKIKQKEFGDVTALQFHISPELDLNEQRVLLLWLADHNLSIQLPSKDMV